ncbi:hypothetical protein AVEN_260265-1 [Araneus ventricosus]|uniref:Uncharacterized protein n=1 Tax=Araneus ventricosus TaxID=182803 RepID=A0A4Y2FKT4_ARAVE|nr:hypothetical protein AVEN_260265-1 [Araneus ventricosus]
MSSLPMECPNGLHHRRTGLTRYGAQLANKNLINNYFKFLFKFLTKDLRVKKNHLESSFSDYRVFLDGFSPKFDRNLEFSRFDTIPNFIRPARSVFSVMASTKHNSNSFFFRTRGDLTVKICRNLEIKFFVDYNAFALCAGPYWGQSVLSNRLKAGPASSNKLVQCQSENQVDFLSFFFHHHLFRIARFSLLQPNFATFMRALLFYCTCRVFKIISSRICAMPKVPWGVSFTTFMSDARKVRLLITVRFLTGYGERVSLQPQHPQGPLHKHRFVSA